MTRKTTSLDIPSITTSSLTSGGTSPLISPQSVEPSPPTPSLADSTPSFRNPPSTSGGTSADAADNPSISCFHVLCYHRAQASEYKIRHRRRRRALTTPPHHPHQPLHPRTSPTTPTTRTLDSTPPYPFRTTRASQHRTSGLTSHRADSKFFLPLSLLYTFTLRLHS